MNAETNAAGHAFSQDSEADGEMTAPNKRSVDTRPLTRAMNKTGKSSSAFKTISEVADELGVQQHVLRFWETKFSQIKPLKRGGGRRYYRPEDVELIQSIQHLLYTEGYTIKGVQKLMRQQGKKSVVEYAKQASNGNADISSAPQSAAAVAVNAGQDAQALAESLSGTQREVLRAMLEDLKELRDLIKSE